MSRVRLSIGHKLGLLHGTVVVLLAIVAGLVWTNLAQIRVDADQLVQETREATLSSSLRGAVDAVQAVLAVGSGPRTRELALEQLTALDRTLGSLEAPHPHDPDREAHETAEDRILRIIRSDVEALRRTLADESDQQDPQASIARIQRYVGTLADETVTLANEVARDVFVRSRTAGRTLTLAVLGVAAALGTVWLMVRRTVVRPLRSLHAHTEALGESGFTAPEPIRSHDEIGVLARAFRRMAERIAEQQQELHERVATRTRDFVRAARYADLGVLAAGVAHEINNPLASITSCAEGLERRLQRGPVEPAVQREFLRTIVGEAFRAREITDRLLRLARPAPDATPSAALTDVLDDLQRVARHQLEARGQRLAIDDASGGMRLCGDRGELLQALHNLVLNASDAAPADTTIDVEARPDDSGGIAIAVHDAGPGVPDAVADRIFEPFFTTTAVGRGTGLGLALVAATAEVYGGSVALEPSTRGARFVLRLPGVPAEDERT